MKSFIASTVFNVLRFKDFNLAEPFSSTLNKILFESIHSSLRGEALKSFVKTLFFLFSWSQILKATEEYFLSGCPVKTIFSPSKEALGDE